MVAAAPTNNYCVIRARNSFYLPATLKINACFLFARNSFLRENIITQTFFACFFVYLAKLSAETRNLSRKLKKILMPAIGLTVLGSLIYAVELVCTDMHEQNLERLL